MPSLWLVLATLVGGALAAGSANAINCVVDADIDAVMRRTRTRTLARHLVPTRNALVFGIVLGVAAFGFLLATTTWQAAVLAVVAILFYVFVYSIWLKRRTSQNIVWGGLAGCMPVIIGWSAVTGTIGWPAWVFFGVIFFWTPPHTWALAMRYREDYAAAGRADAAGGRPGAGRRPADRALQLGDGGLLAAADPGLVVDLRRRGRAGRPVVPGHGAPAARAGAARRRTGARTPGS